MITPRTYEPEKSFAKEFRRAYGLQGAGDMDGGN